MNTIAVVSIIVEDYSATETINAILHKTREYVIGRLGVPYAKRKIGVISVVYDAPQATINELVKEIDALSGVNCHAIFSTNE